MNWIEDRWRDLQYAFRQLRREKTFATFAILTLAFGIGAVTTTFSIVETVLLKPLAYKDPGRLYAASESAAKLARVMKGKQSLLIRFIDFSDAARVK